jgi:hypothetical protein
VGLAGEEPARRLLGPQRGQPGTLLVLGDRPGLQGHVRPPCRHLGRETGRVALRWREGAHADGFQAELGQERWQPAGQPGVDDEVVGGGADDPAGQRPVRMGEDDAVPVQVEDPDAPAGARDADQLRDRLLRLGQVRQRGDRAAATADVEHPAPGDAGQLQVGGACRHPLGVLRAQLQQRGQLADLCGVRPGAVAPQVEPPVAGAGRGRRVVGFGGGHGGTLRAWAGGRRRGTGRCRRW